MSVFRELRQERQTSHLVAELISEFDLIFKTIPFAGGDVLGSLLESALLRAGELEAGLADAGLPANDALSSSAIRFGQVTDLLAQALLAPDSAGALSREAERICRNLPLPEFVQVSPPEGFCFYALHPLDYVELLASISLPSRPTAVIGIRGIGTTLSAVVAAALRRHNAAARVARVTVRPQGHPYNRRTKFDSAILNLVLAYQQMHATFLVVDEGPGLSGSSFLSVGEELIAHGIPSANIVFLGSRSADPESLVADHAGERWRRFQSYATPRTSQVPGNATRELGNGDWRRTIFALPSQHDDTIYQDEARWPAHWFSSPKYISDDGATLFKYEGLGRFGAAVRARAALAAESHFAPAVSPATHGFSAYSMEPGRLMSARDISSAVLERMARYLALRAIFFQVYADNTALEAMTRFNYLQITGTELSGLELSIACPVIADARMMPHEWLRSAEPGSTLLKLDSAAHGDNHFFPGPTDIAWDLAGAIIEWEMPPAAAEYFLSSYERASPSFSKDRIRNRLPDYLIAYSAFHAGHAYMAASSVGENGERARFERDFKRYREALIAASQHRSRILAS